MTTEPKPATPTPPDPKILPPTPVAKQWVNYVLGFGVGVAIGLSVYLGRAHVPLFTPLLDLIPESLQDTLIPLSSALMGTIAVAVQFWAYRRWSAKHLAPPFTRVLIGTVAAIILLLVINTFVVVRIETTPGHRVTFLVGFTRPERPPCTAEVSDEECITRLTFNLDKIASFWGGRPIRLAGLALGLSYLATTSMFGALVGLVVLTARRQP